MVVKILKICHEDLEIKTFPMEESGRRECGSWFHSRSGGSEFHRWWFGISWMVVLDLMDGGSGFQTWWFWIS